MLGYMLSKVKLKDIFVIIIVLSICFYALQTTLFWLEQSENHPVIIWWTPFMGESQRIIECDQYTCLLTKDREYRHSSNVKAFLFYGSEFEISDLPVPKDKIWAIIHEESPRNVAIFLYPRTFELFEITSTFSRYSDLPLTLQYLKNLSIITDTRYFMKVKEKNKLLDNLAPVLYIQSDCDTPNDRDNYVGELMKHIKVDSYGLCLTNKKFPKEIAEIYSLDLYNDKLLNFISKYKFVIAFENAICEDYISEKLWRPLLVGAVPIYLGSPTIENWLPNENSAILAKNFQSPELLAKYIKKININDSLYETFLEHKRGIVTNTLLKTALAKGPFGIATDQDHPILAFECFVCQSVHEGVSIKKKSQSVYDCLKPNVGNSWEYYWHSGDCKSKVLVNFVKNNVKLEADPC